MTTITIPTLHPDQIKAYQTAGRFKAIRCGRRWGKTEMAVAIAAQYAAGFPGNFAAAYARWVSTGKFAV
jgi:hypothetical protein